MNTLKDLYPYIFKRKSVRKFQTKPLDQKDLAEINSFIQTIRPMIPDIKVRTEVVGSSDVKGMGRTNAPHFLLFYSEVKDNYLANAGFMLQQLDLYLSVKGIGNCYQGLTKPRKEIDAPSGMEFIIMMSFGLPDEVLLRKGPEDFKRLPVSEISKVKGMEECMEAARLAPSSMNNQSWFFTGGDGIISAYYERSLIADRFNQINVGIALCHIAAAAENSGKRIEFVKDDAVQMENVKGHSYVISAKLS